MNEVVEPTAVGLVRLHCLQFPQLSYELIEREAISRTLCIRVHVVMLNHMIEGDSVTRAQLSREFDEGAHLRRRRFFRPARADGIVLSAEITYQADSYVRVVAGRVCAPAVLRATGLYRTVREYDVVITDVVDLPPVENMIPALPVYFIEPTDVERGSVEWRRNGRVMNYDAGGRNRIPVRDRGNAGE